MVHDPTDIRAIATAETYARSFRGVYFWESDQSGTDQKLTRDLVGRVCVWESDQSEMESQLQKLMRDLVGRVCVWESDQSEVDSDEL